MKRIAFLVFGILISIVSLYYALRGFDMNDLWLAMANVQYAWLLVMVAPYILTFMTKVWRWRDLFHPDERRYSIGTLFSCLMISYIPLPFRAGEVARGAVFAARTDTPLARVLSTIFVEKVLDVLTLLLFLGISLPSVGLPRDLQGPATVLGAVFSAIAILLIVLVIRPDFVRKLARPIERILPARYAHLVDDAVEHGLQGLAPLSSPLVALRIGMWSIASWGINAITLYCLMRAFNIDLPPMAAVMLMVATNLGMVVPSAPGYVGPFEFVVVAVLTLLGIPYGTAQSFALVYHVVGLVPVASIGIFSVFTQGIGLAAFRTGGATQPDMPAASAARPEMPTANGSRPELPPQSAPARPTAPQTHKPVPEEKR
jgi:uncharacterized protein (TIRG00374 family)